MSRLIPEVGELLTGGLLDILHSYYGTWFKPVSVRM